MALYGDIPLHVLLWREVSGRALTKVSSLTDAFKDQSVVIQARVQMICVLSAFSKTIAILTVREGYYTVQCMVKVTPDLVSTEMVEYVTTITKESYVEIEGIVNVPPTVVKGASQQVMIFVRKIFTINRAPKELFISIEKDLEAGEQPVRVNQDTHLEMRTPATQGIFRLQSRMKNLFQSVLLKEGFLWLNTPTLIECPSQGGADVFELKYFGQPASPQLFKQMIYADFRRVFVIGPAFRAERLHTHRHLCQFTRLDVEMVIEEHYYEVIYISCAACLLKCLTN